MNNYFTQLYTWMLAFLSPVGNKKGQTLVEYALILVLLVAIVIAAMILLRGGANSAVSKVVNSLTTDH